jgi:hypothetical protein
VAKPRKSARQRVAAAPGDGGASLARVESLLGAKQLGPAVEALVGRWRETRAPALADLIDRANRLLPAYDRPLATSRAGIDAAWTAAFESDAQAALPQLLENLLADGDDALASRRIARLAELPDDPRIAMRIAELAPRAGDTSGVDWAAAFELLVRIDDARTREPLRHHVEPPDETERHAAAKQIALDYADADVDVAAMALADQEAARATAIDRVLRRMPMPEWDLVDAIRDDGDAARKRYAAWLSERDHPRGELIALALKRRDDREQKRLDQLAQIPYLYGALDDLVARDPAPEQTGGLYSAIAIAPHASTITWARVSQHALVLALDRVDLGDARAPLPDHFKTFLSRGRHIATVTGLGGAAHTLEDAYSAKFDLKRGELVRR